MDASIFSVSPSDSDYPALLRELSGAPSPLFYRGLLPPKDLPLIAVVGTRKATPEGRTLARRIARACAERTIGVVSGLALGIDGAAHEGALAGGGRTFAVMANGLDRVYPPSHETLAARMLAAGGGIFSEYPAGTPALPHQFLERNRIIAGLCIATVVIEAPERSGAIATARNAAEAGREVFVFPGDPDHPNYRGAHRLIRNGARLVTSAEDIFEDMGIAGARKETQPKLFGEGEDGAVPTGENEAQRALLAALATTQEILSIDKLVRSTKLEPKIVGRELALLLLSEKVEEERGGFRLKRPL